MAGKGGESVLSDQEDYQSLLSDLVKKQMVMLGPQVAISKARTVAGLTVGQDGQVTAISGDPHSALEQLASEYMKLSGQIATTTLQLLLEQYPAIKSRGLS